jgi:lipopolysaccharide/colanic/teichoic acid biosynthesis glycosyltransferase
MTGLSGVRARIQRFVTAACAALLLIALGPLLLIIATAIKLSSSGPVIFRQTRVGLGFRSFTLYKFRTMANGGQDQGIGVTPAGDQRVTPVGRVLRALKLDEIPQLWNVAMGDMAFVGPRPELPEFVAAFREEYTEILTIPPGITDPASVKYADEGRLLSASKDPVAEYLGRILPDKVRLSRDYVRNRSFALDVRIVFRTLTAVLLRTGQRPSV